MHLHRLIVLLCGLGLLAISTSVYAQDGQSRNIKFGLAMHGTPKYNANSPYLDYVNPSAPKGGALKMAATGTFDTLNPFSIKGKSAQGLNMVYDRLMARVWDEPFTLYPLIAKGYEIADDRSWITFHIDPDARFSDGSPIRAADILFSFETLKEHGRPNMRKVYRLVTHAQKTSENAVRFDFGEGHDRETAMILAIMPVLSKAYWGWRIENGEDFDSTTLDTPITNGSYRIKSIDAGRSIRYERDPNYWAKDHLTNIGHHNFETITYEYYRDDTVAFEGFKSGESDLRREWDAGKWASAYDFPAIRSGEITAEPLPHSRPERTRGLIFNTRRAPFDDIKVREALSLVFDFEWINANLFSGQYKRITSYFPNSELAAVGTPSKAELAILEPYKNDLPNSVFTALPQAPPQNKRANLRKADALLKDAGWVVENGKRVKNGQEFSFEILLSVPEDEKIALHFKQSLARLGISPSIRVMDSASYRDRINGYDFDMTSYFWRSSLSPGTEQILYWGCEAAKQDSRWNFPGICHPAIDAISGQIAQTTARSDLVAHMRALDRLLLAGHYMIPLYYAGEDYVAYQSRLKHPDKTPLYGMVLETWWNDPKSEEKPEHVGE